MASIATPAPTLRQATAADVPELARMLARAFLDDPGAVWSCRADALRPAVLERFQAARLRQLLPEGEVWTTARAQLRSAVGGAGALDNERSRGRRAGAVPA